MRNPFKKKAEKQAETTTEPTIAARTEENITAQYDTEITDPETKELWESLNTEEGQKKRKAAITRRKFLNGAIGAAGIILVLKACAPHKNNIDLSGTSTPQEDGARNFATALVKDWYTWNKEDQQERGERLAKYNPAWRTGQGIQKVGESQTVTSAWPIKTKNDGNNFYTITVAAALEGKIQPLYAQVSIYATDSGYSPINEPSLVAAPELPVAEEPSNDRQNYSDNAGQKEIRDVLEVFFKAWGTADTAAIKSTTVTGYAIAPMLTEQTFKELQDVTFKIDAEDAEKKDEIPDPVYVNTTTVWEVAGGTSLTSSYQFEMKHDNGRWLIAKMDTNAFDSDSAVKTTTK